MATSSGARENGQQKAVRRAIFWMWTFFISAIGFAVFLTAMHIVFPYWAEAIMDGKIRALHEMTDFAKGLAAFIAATTSLLVAFIALLKSVSAFKRVVAPNKIG
jgi:magnesium-transporting ATPase (P-type)